VGVDNGGFTVVDPGKGLGGPAPLFPTYFYTKLRPEVHHKMGRVNIEDGRRGLIHRYPKCSFLKESNYNFIGRHVSQANKNTT